MNYNETFQAIKSEGFSDEVAILATMMVGLNVSKKVTKKHLTGEKSFSGELEEQFKKTFWEHTTEVVEEAMAVWRVFHDYETHKMLQGLGGCVAKTIRQLIAEKSSCDSGNR